MWLRKLKLTGQMSVKDKKLEFGQGVAVEGVVTPNYELTSVSAAIVGSSYSVKIDPVGKSFNLASWDSKLLFSKLAPGKYTYRVTATDAYSQTVKTLQSEDFEVKPPPPLGKELVTTSQLQKIGWSGVTPAMVAKLNETLYKYKITSKEDIRHFITQSGFESGRGKYTLELGDQSKKPYGEKYKGSGYIQLTWDYNYKKFAEHMNDPKILSEGAKYVAEKYPWEASGFWWDGNDMHSVATSSSEATSNTVSKRVNGAGCTTLKQRYAEYLNVAKYI